VGRGRRLGADRQIALRNYRHLPLTVTHGPSLPRWLAAVVRGHQACYAVPGNSDAVNAFRTQVIRHWRKALRRRSQRTRLTWARMNRIAARWIPPTRTVPAGALRRPAPKVGAQCGSSARRDLRGGPPARAVPTATLTGSSGAAARRRAPAALAPGVRHLRRRPGAPRRATQHPLSRRAQSPHGWPRLIAKSSTPSTRGVDAGGSGAAMISRSKVDRLAMACSARARRQPARPASATAMFGSTSASRRTVARSSPAARRLPYRPAAADSGCAPAVSCGRAPGTPRRPGGYRP